MKSGLVNEEKAHAGDGARLLKTEQGYTPGQHREVQCADCRQWIDADNNHTCRQQVERNRKGGK